MRTSFVIHLSEYTTVRRARSPPAVNPARSRLFANFLKNDMEALMRRSIKRRWRMATAIAMITAILLSSLGIALKGVSAQTSPAVFRVDAQGRITKNGVVYPIHGGSWFGLQGRHEPSNDSVNPSGAPMEQYMGNVFWAPSG